MPKTDKYDPDGIDKAAQACEAKGGVIVYGGIVKKINETKGESKRILIVSDTFITFVKSVIISLSHTCYWSDLSSVRFIDNDGMELIFKIIRKNSSKTKQFRFRSRERPVIIRKIIDLLYHTMTPVELSKIDLEFPHPPISINPRGVLSRFDEHLAKSNISLADCKLREQINLDCQIMNPICIPKAIESRKELKAVFYAIIGSSFTKAAFFPEIKDMEILERLYKYMSFLVSTLETAEFFSFKTPIIPKFDDFSKALIDKSETPINGIGFRDVSMSEEDTQKVSKLVGEANLMSLRWCTISPVTSCETLLKEKKLRRSLRYLALDRSKGINFPKIAPKLSHIVVLSLEYSNLEIADIFKYINKSNLSQLKMLNLSYNNASKPFESSTVISPKLQRIDISHVKFSNNVMKNILEVILKTNYENGLRFYCDKFHAENDEIEKALLSFQKIKSKSLVEFSWRRNKVDKNLLNFFKNSSNLEKLMLEGNIFNNEEEITKEFASICPSLKNLTNLYICGYKNGKLETSFQNQLIDSLKKLPKLSYLDISNNSVSDEGIQAITISLKEFSNLTHIVLDNNNITSLDPITKLAEKAQQLFKNLYISWPLNDIQSLQKDNIITDSEISDLKSKINKAKSASNTSSFNDGTIKQISIPLDNGKIVGSKSIPLDDGVVVSSKSKAAINSASVRNKSNINQKQRKQRTGSVFIRTGSVRSLKRALAEGDERSQDPDSIFIQPFDVWLGKIDDNNFPLYLSEELATNLDIVKYDPQNDLDSDETESAIFSDDDLSNENENENKVQTRSVDVSAKKKRYSISNYSDNEENNSNDDHENDHNDSDNSDNDNNDHTNYRTKTNQVRQIKSNDSDSENDNQSNQQIKKFVKPPPPLKPVNKVLNSLPKNQKSPHNARSNTSGFRNNNIDDDDDEPGEVKERNITIDIDDNDDKESVLHGKINKERISEVDSDDYVRTAPLNTSSQRYPKRDKQSPTSRFSQSQNRSPKSVTKRSAPTLDLDDSELADVAYDNQADEAVPFEAPSWSFPVPRISRVSNNSFVKELNDKYSVASVINSLRSKK